MGWSSVVPGSLRISGRGAASVEDPVPYTKYVGDITYLTVGDGQFLYLATVLDLHSKRLVGWSIADHMRTELVTDALEAAARTRGKLAEQLAKHKVGGGDGRPGDSAPDPVHWQGLLTFMKEMRIMDKDAYWVGTLMTAGNSCVYGAS
ncbi:hypothetical protein GCM10020367_69980 [Streptomyces sannanensis]|uniref:Integrase catalytic domain-containing protein n=1 Tax=Streptomyces sannanensis TaxID=285536 RepID=A0ABP6SNK1_9ACTN